MSKKVDERVVEMRFDNAQFERNVQTSMSTIDKLKEKLNFKGVGNGLENISNAAKRIDMSSVGESVDKVRLKFSALEVMGVTVLANISNAVLSTGANIAKSLTIDPITTGLQEYETQINAIQTIMANTASKGTTLDQVNSALAELNKYADQTIYNFTEMTRNIGTFTAAGVGLETSVNSIKGIANLAAISGSSATQASTAMYQLSQAIAAGKVQLMDWNSVVNAGMGGEVFQNALKRTAEHFGYNVDAMIAKYGSFRESLTQGGWLTTEVLTETLTQLSGAYTEADLIAQGYTENQAKEIVKLAETAVSAATDIKTFTQLMDTMKESVQSGWAQTWQLIIGDFEEAKGTLSKMSELFGGVIQGISDARNNLLSGALDSNWEKLIDQINEAGIATEDFNNALTATAKENGINVDALIEKYGSLAKAFQEGAISSDIIINTIKKLAGVTEEAVGSTEDMTEKLKRFQEVVDKVWNGTYGNGAERIKALTAAGYDYAKVQDLVNKTVDGHRLTLEDLGEEQLKSIGYTDQEITKLQELAEQAEKTGTPLNELITNITKPSGRELLWDTVLTSLKSIISIGQAVGDALKDAFGDNITSSGLYNLIEGINRFSHILAPTEKDLKNITSTFKGLFAVIDIFTTITGGALKIGLKALGAILGNMDLGILDVTAAVGEAIAAFRDWLFENNLIIKGLEKLADAAGKAMRALFDTPFIQGLVQQLQNGFNQMVEVGRNAIEGLKQGLREGIYSVPEILIEIGNAILNAIKGVLGIHSPSTKMHEVGEDTIEGLLNGLKEGASKVIEFFAELGQKIVNSFKAIEFGKIFSLVFSVAFVYFLKKLYNTFDAITAPLAGVGSVLDGVGKILDKSAKPIAKVIKSVGNAINAFAFKTSAAAIKDIAISLAVLSASILLLSKIDTGKLFVSIGAIAALAGVIVLLSAAINKFGPSSSIKLGGFALALVGISTSLLVAAAAIKQLSKIDPDKINQSLTAFVAMIGSLGLLIASFGIFVKGENAKNISKLGTMMIKLSISLLLLSAVIKILGNMSGAELAKGGGVIVAFIGIIALLGQVTKMYDRNVSKLGGTMIKMSIAMGLMVIVIKMISDLSVGEILKGAAAISGFIYVIGLLSMIVNRYDRGNIGKLSASLVGISVSMMLLVGVIKLISGIEIGDIVKGTAAIFAFTGIISILVQIIKMAGPSTPKIAATLLAMSMSIGIIAGIAVVLSLIDTKGLIKGIAAVTALSAIMAGLIYVTKYAGACKGELIVISIAIGVMAAAIAALSFIDPASLAGATIALSVLMGMFALVVKSSRFITGGLAQLIVMTTAITIMGTLIIIIANLPIENALGASASLSILMLSLAAAMTIASKTGPASIAALGSIGVMVLTIGALSLIISYLSKMDATSVISIAASLSALLLSLSAAMVILSGIGAKAPMAIVGALALDGVILAIGGFMAGIGALAVYFPALEEFLDKGIGLLEKIGYGLGNFFGSIVGGFASGAMSGLPDIGTELSSFMTNIQPFITGASSIDPGSMDGIKSLAQAILIITGAGIIEGVASWLTGGSSMEEFAKSLVPFGTAMKEFSTSIAGMDAELVTNAAIAGKALAEMATAVPNTGGVVAFFTGDNADMETFGKGIVAFGNAMKEYSIAIAGIDTALITNSATAGQALTQMASTVPNTGGVIAFFTGDNADMAAFGSGIVAFGSAMKAYADSISGLDVNLVVNSATAGQALTQMANTIPNTGGLISFLAGDNADMATFGSGIVAFGNAMKEYSIAIAGFDANAVTSSMSAAQALTSLANSIPNSGGLITMFTGSNDMTLFGSQLVAFGKSFAEYATSMAAVNPTVVTATTSAAQSLVSLSDAVPNKGLFEEDLTDFGKELVSFGKHFASFYEKISGINASALSSSVSSLKELISVINGMGSIDTKSISNFADAMKKLGSVSVDEFVSSFKDASTKVSSAVDSLFDAFNKGITRSTSGIQRSMSSLLSKMVKEITSKQRDISSASDRLMKGISDSVTKNSKNVTRAFNTMLTSAANAIRSKYSSFYSSGAYLCQGLANGISANSYMVRAKAAAMASSAASAARRALDEHSPSRVFYEIGDYAGLGFIKALDDYVSISKDAGEEIANSAIKGLGNSIRKIERVINSDIDVTPTIRPVLDFSSVESGVDQIDKLFGDKTLIGSIRRVDTIGRQMNQKGQNGNIDDVIRAIDRLRKKLDENDRPIYNINGITYDDGTNVSDAIQTLIRAARIERRT